MASVKLLKLLKPACVIPRIEAETKQDAIEELLQALAAQGAIRDIDVVRKDVLERESRMSTGIPGGLAIPHAKSDGAREVAVAVGLKPEGIDFEALDGQPSYAIFLVVSGEAWSTPQLECLAQIAKLYSRPEARDRILSATTREQVLAALDS